MRSRAFGCFTPASPLPDCTVGEARSEPVVCCKSNAAPIAPSAANGENALHRMSVRFAWFHGEEQRGVTDCGRPARPAAGHKAQVEVRFVDLTREGAIDPISELGADVNGRSLGGRG